MLRRSMIIGGSITNNSLGVLSTLPNTVCVQCVRWRRKPRWFPVAKSKVFRVPVRPVIPPDEKIEITRLHNNYKTVVRSLRSHIRETMFGGTVQEDMALREIDEKDDYARCEALNNEWNEAIAKRREMRLAKSREHRSEDILKKILQKEHRDHVMIKRIEEKVKQVKLEAVTFITEENIDQAIQDALDNPVNHNWAIDESGTRHYGKYVKPEKGGEYEKRTRQNV